MTTVSEVDVLITGAGVGGAMLGLALGRAGVRVLLAEPGPDIPPRGADILKPRGIRVLRDHGVLPTLQRGGALCRDRIHYFHDGQPLFDLDFTEHSDPSYFLIAPYRRIVASLLDACAAQPSVRIAFDAPVADIRAGAGRTHHASLHNGHNVRAEVIVGADGPRSPVLTYLGAEPQLRTYEQVVWVATVATPSAGTAGNRLFFSSSGSFAYAYPIDAGSTRVFLGLPAALADVSNSEPGAVVLDLVSSFVPDLSVVDRLADATWQVMPVAAWQTSRLVSGTAAALGHAAFATHPMTGLGMSVTLEDATVLAEAIIDALYTGRDAGELLEARYGPRAELHRELIAYGDALATSFPDATAYRRQFRPRLHSGDR